MRRLFSWLGVLVVVIVLLNIAFGSTITGGCVRSFLDWAMQTQYWDKAMMVLLIPLDEAAYAQMAQDPTLPHLARAVLGLVNPHQLVGLLKEFLGFSVLMNDGDLIRLVPPAYWLAQFAGGGDDSGNQPPPTTPGGDPDLEDVFNTSPYALLVVAVLLLLGAIAVLSKGVRRVVLAALFLLGVGAVLALTASPANAQGPVPPLTPGELEAVRVLMEDPTLAASLLEQFVANVQAASETGIFLWSQRGMQNGVEGWFQWINISTEEGIFRYYAQWLPDRLRSLGSLRALAELIRQTSRLTGWIPRDAPPDSWYFSRPLDGGNFPPTTSDSGPPPQGTPSLGGWGYGREMTEEVLSALTQRDRGATTLFILLSLIIVIIVMIVICLPTIARRARA